MSSTGIYIHVPFCLSRCRYCAFYSETCIHELSRYFDALCREISLEAAPGLTCDSVYFGGGTPSLLRPGAVWKILSHLRKSFDLCESAEITLEVNPGTLDRAFLSELHAAGVNRLVVGVQSFCPEDLRFLGRRHSPEDAVRCLRAARSAGFTSVGMDLIYGLPGRGPAHWERQLDQALSFDPEHLSCYALTLEPGTPLEREHRTGAFQVPSEGEGREAFLLTLAFLADRGYPYYEVSNFSRSGDYPSRHNAKYWDGTPYLGFGPSAHSFTPNVRSWNCPSVFSYMSRLEADQHPEGDWEELDPEQVALERLLLGLRTAHGVDLSRLEADLCPGFLERNQDLLQKLETDGLGTVSDSALMLSPSGLAVSDGIPAMFSL